jgi:16S rRNA (uracil1498-N3)-methyltransferase
MVSNYTKAPRLYGEYDLSNNQEIELSDDHNHYLLSVMRRQDGEIVRIFNGIDGEYIGTISKLSKKTAILINLHQTRAQPHKQNKKTLYFPLIKKDRMAFMIEKSVELGVTDLIPFTSDHTDTPRFNETKTKKHIIEATEQCERLNVPRLQKILTIDEIIKLPTSIYCALERHADLQTFKIPDDGPCSCIVGPEGGWSNREIELLQNNKNIIPVSLGNTILRAETAAIYMLARLAG